MVEVVDARGQDCPQPVILARNAMQAAEEVSVIVDNETAQHNVTRMAMKAGWTVQVEHKPDGIYLHIGGGTGGASQQAGAQWGGMVSTPVSSPLVLVVPDERMGRGDPELGGVLMRAFFHTLGEVEPLPDVIIFMNSGVKLVVEGSPVLPDLLALCGEDTQILASGTCLGFYQIKEKVAVGEVSNMYTIAETLLNAGRVISL